MALALPYNQSSALAAPTVSKLYLHLIHSYLCQLDSFHALSSELSTLIKDLDKENFRYGQQITLAEMESVLSALSDRFGGLSFGLEIGRHVHPSDLGIVGYALMNSETLLHALHMAGKLKNMMNEGFDIALEAQGEYCKYRVKNHLDSESISALIEMDFAIAIQFARFLVGSQKASEVKLIQVNFQHQPLAARERYEELFSCPVSFGMDSSEIIISRKVLDVPVRSSDPRLFKVYLRKIERMRNCRQSAIPTHQKIFAFVAKHMGKELPGIDSAANYLNMSISTLKSQLRQDGLNYSQVVDLVRQDKAVKMVNSPTVQIKEIAYALGFSNQSAFTRAFKRWTNMSPAEYRRQM